MQVLQLVARVDFDVDIRIGIERFQSRQILLHEPLDDFARLKGCGYRRARILRKTLKSCPELFLIP